MNGSSFGNHFKITTFGESHGAALGVIVDGCPAGIPLSEEYIQIDSDVPKSFAKKDGASKIANYLFEEATHINFFVGQAVNEAHKGLPIDSTLKFKLVERLSNNLRMMGKEIDIKYY